MYLSTLAAVTAHDKVPSHTIPSALSAVIFLAAGRIRAVLRLKTPVPLGSRFAWFVYATPPGITAEQGRGAKCQSAPARALRQVHGRLGKCRSPEYRNRQGG